MEQYINRTFSVLYRYGQRFFIQKLKEHKMPFEVGQFPFLMQVYRHPGITQEGISANAVMDKGTTARSIKQLEELGLVRREIDASDRRIHHIYPTPEAMAIKEQVIGVINDLHEILYKGFSKEEIDLVTSMTERMKANIADYLNGNEEG